MAELVSLSTPNQAKRIALLYDCAYPFVPGGGQKRLFEISRRLVGMGWKIDWYCLKSWPEGHEMVVDGIRLVPVGLAVPMYGKNGKRSISQTLYYGRAITGFPALRNYDIIHLGQWPYFHFFPVLFFSFFGKAKITADWWEVWGREWLSYYGLKGLLGMVLERICSRIPQTLIAISDTGVKQLADIGVKITDIEIVHNGIDFHRIFTTPPANLRSDLIYLGRLQSHKNVDVLIEAISHLRSRGQSVTLTIIGDGPERNALEAQCARLNLLGNIVFLGAVPDDNIVYANLKASKVFVHPSTKEGGGSITSLEANAAGLPVIAFRHPGGISPELIEEGFNGYWVSSLTSMALSETIATALQNANSSSSQHCIAFAQKFDWALLAKQYHSIFSRLA